MTSFPSWNSHLQQQQYISPPTCFTTPSNQHFDQIQDQHAYPYEQYQNQFGCEAYQEQGYACNEDNQIEDADFVEKIQKMEAKMVQSRETTQMKAFRIGCKNPCPWGGPFPRHFIPQEKLEFMMEMVLQFVQWIVEIEAYKLCVQQPCQR
ncbi:hypothetical protein KI387_044618, partial [Taxus chinensis]